MPKQKYRLDEHLILSSYFLNLFGKSSFDELRNILKDVDDGFDEDGRSFVFHALYAQKDIKLPKDKLEEYDRNIHTYIESINAHRERYFIPKYFQYMTLLFTEIFLNKFFESHISLLNELNEFAASIDDNDIFFARDDLKKLAYWMATGSGKTLLMHANYLQFLRYNKGENKLDFDNILLITPSEMLTEQHLREMKESGITAERFDIQGGARITGVISESTVQVIDIHKLTEEKKGQGVSVDIESFGYKNLVFVDEGHKGSGGEKWRKFRDSVAKEGFTFEYSATFGQAIAAAGRDAKSLLNEYGKAIICDYSYKHFYRDGYGKDYLIINLKEKSFSDETRDVLMLANLLTFFEQKLLFQKFGTDFIEYHIEEPLWVFVGSRVKGKTERSDVRSVIEFLQRVTKNEHGRIVETIAKILEGDSGLLDSEDRDLFSPEFPDRTLQYIRDEQLDAEEIYKSLLELVFHVPASTSLCLSNIKNADGEIALKAGNNPYFGLINIGDDSDFLKEVREDSEIQVMDDILTPSLFAEIDQGNSDINILIGAKKFIEGWNSWRVSNMGLLNIGKNEGSQIIQLFGRGVRLRGKDGCLKRSRAIEGCPPKYLEALETLNIFGIQADYMDRFREYLEAEGIDTDNYEEFPYEIRINKDHLDHHLMVTTTSKEFKGDYCFELAVDGDMRPVVLDLMPKIEMVTSLAEAALKTSEKDTRAEIDVKYFDLLDWNRIYFEVLELKREKRIHNCVIKKETLIAVMKEGQYELHCPHDYVNPRRFADLHRLEDIVILILKKYVIAFYQRTKNKWLQDNLELVPLTEKHGDLDFDPEIRVKESDKAAIEEIGNLMNDDSFFDEFESSNLENVYFDHHIYQPLLAHSESTEQTPLGLNKGEKEFVEDLRKWLDSNQGTYDDKEIFILRNLPRRGVGFFESRYFYPDFVIWVDSKDKQHIIFVDPKGLVHARQDTGDEKLELHKRIKELEAHLAKKKQKKAIVLDSYIISATPYDDIKAIFEGKSLGDLEKDHILFQVDDKKGYIKKLLAAALKINMGDQDNASETLSR